MILLENDLKNFAKAKQPTGGVSSGDGDGGGGGGACATKLHIRTFSDFKSTIRQLENKEKASSSSSSLKLECAKVPQSLRSDVKDVEVYYEPQVISFGPYHHGKPHLEEGETLKLKLAANYFREYELLEDKIYEKISCDIEALRKCYSRRSTEEYTDEELGVMFLVDGCALLWYILCVCLGDHEEYGIRYQDLSRIHQDVLLLENQLPYRLLHNHIMSMSNYAWTVIFQEFFGMSTDESFFQEFFGRKEESFLRKMKSYCRLFLFRLLRLSPIKIINLNPNPTQKLESIENSMPCRHILDLYRKNFLGDERSYPLTHSESTATVKKGLGSVGDVKDQVMASFRNVKELMTAGIRIKPSPTRYLRDISFTSNGITACLRLPPITIDSSTKKLFLNLIAYEMSSDVPHDFISYLRFLDSLVDHADDVKELQAAGILQNNLGTHEQVADFFNTVSSNLESNFHAYKDVRVKIRKHLKSHYNIRLKIWITQCLDTYFGNPWTIIAWVGAALALFFTAVQTYFVVFHS